MDFLLHFARWTFFLRVGSVSRRTCLIAPILPSPSPHHGDDSSFLLYRSLEYCIQLKAWSSISWRRQEFKGCSQGRWSVSFVSTDVWLPLNVPAVVRRGSRLSNHSWVLFWPSLVWLMTITTLPPQVTAMKSPLRQTRPSLPLVSPSNEAGVSRKAFRSTVKVAWERGTNRERATKRRSGAAHQSVSAFVSIFFLVYIYI